MAILRDISVDDTDDIIVTSGDLVLNSDLDAIAQDCKAALRLVLGEWYLASNEGVDWYGKILVKNPNMNVVRAVLRAAILGVVGIKEVTPLALDYTDRVRRKVSCTFTASTDLGEITATIAGP